jgi:hypothetical protein
MFRHPWPRKYSPTMNKPPRPIVTSNSPQRDLVKLSLLLRG